MDFWRRTGDFAREINVANPGGMSTPTIHRAQMSEGQ